MDNPEKIATQNTKHEEKHNTMFVGHHYTPTHTNNVYKTTGGNDEPNIVFMQKSQRTSQHGTQNVKTHNRTTRKIKKMGNTDPTKKRHYGFNDSFLTWAETLYNNIPTSVINNGWISEI